MQEYDDGLIVCDCGHEVDAGTSYEIVKIKVANSRNEIKEIKMACCDNDECIAWALYHKLNMYYDVIHTPRSEE